MLLREDRHPKGRDCTASLLSSEARGEDGIGANSVEVVWAEVFVDPRALVGILGMSGVG